MVNGLHVNALCSNELEVMDKEARKNISIISSNYDMVLENVDAIYIRSLPKCHYEDIKKALNKGKHVLCESPMTLSRIQSEELLKLAKEKNLILMEAVKTAYATAYTRLLLLIEAGKIGNVISIDSTCTSIRNKENLK